MNIFIEGLQGTGKSTFANHLAKRLPQYPVYREGDYSPVELAWCAYMGKEEYEDILREYASLGKEIEKNTTKEDDKYIVSYTRILAENPQFYKDMEAFEIYNGRVDFHVFCRTVMKRYRQYDGKNGIFECSFFQNAIECMMLFYEMSDESIIDFYRKAFAVMREKNFLLVYLDSEEIKDNILLIKKERTDEKGVECWFPLIMEYLKTSPYGMSKGCQCLDDLVAYLKHRRKLEIQIMKEVMKEKTMILQAKKYDIGQVMKCMDLERNQGESRAYIQK